MTATKIIFFLLDMSVYRLTIYQQFCYTHRGEVIQHMSQILNNIQWLTYG